MNRLVLAVSLGLLLGSQAVAQNISFETPPEELNSVIGLLDAVIVAEQAVLSGVELTETDREAIQSLIRVADVLGAEDLAARSRVLLTLSMPPRNEVTPQPGLIEPLTATSENLFRRSTPEFDTWIGALAATGGTSLALSGIFYGLAERDFRAWLRESERDAAEELFQAWRGYELLSITMGGIAIGALGVGIPLVYGLSAPPEPTGLPLGQTMYTPEERDQTLQALYAERAAIVGSINRVAEVQPRRELWSTVGLAVGALGGITGVTSFYLAGERWEQYIEAPLSDQAEALALQVTIFDVIAISATALSLVGFGTTIGIEVLTEDRAELEARLRAVNREIVRLRSSESPPFPDQTDDESPAALPPSGGSAPSLRFQH